jgi:hypothetical protein
MSDFFVSYARRDQRWAEWISWALEEAGFSVTIQAWDFRAGSNFALEMQRATAGASRTIAFYPRIILSLDLEPRNGRQLLPLIPMA